MAIIIAGVAVIAAVLCLLTKAVGAPIQFHSMLTWLAFGMLGFYNYLLSGLGPLMPSLREELGLSYTIASLHFSAFAVGMIIAGLIGDRVVRRYGRTKVFWAGAAGLVVLSVGLFHYALQLPMPILPSFISQIG